MTVDCVASVLKTRTKSDDILLVSNGSKEGNYRRVDKRFRDDAIMINLSVRRGVASVWNSAIDYFLETGSGFICFLHNDTVAKTGWLDELRLAFDAHPRAGAVFSGQGDRTGRFAIIDNGSPHGFCFMTKRDIVRKIGRFDTSFRIMPDREYFERIKKERFELVEARRSKVYHIGGGTTKKIYSLTRYMELASEELERL
jgi:GT2 family glycosyltransferase